MNIPKTVSLRLNDKDHEYINIILEELNSDSVSTAIKYAIKMASNPKKNEKKLDELDDEDKPTNIETVNGQEFVNLNPLSEEERLAVLTPEEEERRKEIRKRAKENMEREVEMVMTSKGPMTMKAAKLLNLTFTEAVASVNGIEPDPIKVKEEKKAAYRRQHPEVSEAHLDYLMTLETDQDGNLIYE